MSARSSRHSLLLAGALAACGSHAKEKPKPTADPAKVKARAVETMKNMPAIAAVPSCSDADLAGETMTYRTLLQLAGEQIPKDPEHAEWINPHELDAMAARVLAD